MNAMAKAGFARLRVSLGASAMLLAVWSSIGSIAAETPVRGEPRPIGVPEYATPQERGREILRVAIELVKHGHLRDTEFASRLLKLPIVPDVGITLSDSKAFPQQLLKRFGYGFLKLPTGGSSATEQFRIRDHTVSMHLDERTTCLALSDFLSGFNKELGVGMEIVSDDPGSPPPPRLVSHEQGWLEARTFDSRGSLHISQGMPTGIAVSATVPARSQCVSGIRLRSSERR